MAAGSCRLSFIALAILAAIPPYIYASTVGQQSLNQQQQDEARHNKLAPKGQSLLAPQATSKSGKLTFPQESPCYQIAHIQLEKGDRIPRWLMFRDITNQGEGKCLGIGAIKQLHQAVQERLITYGYITTRVLVPNQDLSQGTLTLRILPGVISDISYKDDSGQYIHTINNFPDRKGDLLDLRGLEQGVENLQRIPGTEASIQLLPGDQPGQTRVEVTRTQSKSWRIGSWFSDSGSKSTGRYQAGLAAYLDNPSSLNDMFYLAYGGGLQNQNGRRSDNASAYYSVPWGYWSLDLYGSLYNYTQTVRNSEFSYQYRGEDRYLSAQLNNVIYRSTSQKTTLSALLMKRNSRYYLNDTEVEVQNRDTSNWKLILEHEAFLPFGNVKATLGYQHSAHWFGAQPGAEALVGNADKQARIATVNVDATIPFILLGQSMSYQPHYMQQTTPDRLAQPDKFNIGNRWTVRGFDGETTLYADKGWYLRNDINLNLPKLGLQPYIGVDYGKVNGSKTDYWSGKRLAGGVIGVRGAKWGLGYDFFVGTSFIKPRELDTSPVNLGFTVQWQF